MLVAGALVLTACGQQVPADERLATAAERTTAQDTARFSVESATQMGGEGGARMDMTVVGEGEVDFAAQRWHLRMDVPGMPGGGDHGMEMIADGDTIYSRIGMPGMPDDRWMRQSLDDEELGAASALGMGPMGTDAGSDPTNTLEVLAAAGGDIEELGSEEIGDVTTRGYGFVVTARELYGMDDEAPGAEQLEQAEVRVEAWLDGDDRARRVRHTVDLEPLMSAAQAWVAESDSELGGGGEAMDEGMEGTQTTTVDWFDFGEPVDIPIPDEDEIIDSGRYRGQIGQMSDSARIESDGIIEDIESFDGEGVVGQEEAEAVEEPAAEPAD